MAAIADRIAMTKKLVSRENVCASIPIITGPKNIPTEYILWKKPILVDCLYSGVLTLR